MTIGKRPAIRELSSFPEYVRLQGRLAELLRRREDITLTLSVRAESARLDESRGPDAKAKAAALVAADRLPQTIVAPVVEIGADERIRLRQERRLLEEAIHQAEGQLRTLRFRIGREAVAELRDWHRALVAEMVASARVLRDLARAEADAFVALEDADIPTSCLSEGGPARPGFVGVAPRPDRDDLDAVDWWIHSLRECGHLDAAPAPRATEAAKSAARLVPTLARRIAGGAN